MKFNYIYRYPVIKKIVWTPTTVCNYHCSYCPSGSHDGKYRWPENYTSIIEFINQWRGDAELTLDILGGEPTLWPEFSKFCSELVNSSPAFTKIIFSSNGSRSLRYWAEFDAPVSKIGLSFHPEYKNEEHFINVVKLLHEKYHMEVFLMLIPPYIDLVKSVYESLKEFKVKCTVMSVVEKTVNDHSGIINPLEEYEEFSKNGFFDNSLPFKGTPYQTFIADNDQVLSPINPQHLINTQQDNFKGWDCYVGRDTLNIHPNGDVYGSSCSVGPCYGNIHDQKKIEIINSPIKCPYEYCGCGTDIEIEKKNV